MQEEGSSPIEFALYGEYLMGDLKRRWPSEGERAFMRPGLTMKEFLGLRAVTPPGERWWEDPFEVGESPGGA